MDPLMIGGGAAAAVVAGSMFESAQDRAQDIGEALGLVPPKKSTEELLVEVVDLLRTIANNTMGDLSYDVIEAQIVQQNVDFTFHKGERKYANVYFATEALVDVYRPGVGTSFTTIPAGWSTFGLIEGIQMRLDPTSPVTAQNMLVVYSNTSYDGFF
jgi:hypothetical protein